MPRYMYTTPPRANSNPRTDTRNLDTVEAALAGNAFTGCSVWRYIPRSRHWPLIFDTSVPQTRIGTNADYWQRVKAHELQGGGA